MHVLADIFTSFAPFGAVHVATVAMILLASIWAVRHRRLLPEEPSKLRFDRVLVVLGFALVVVNQTSELWPSRFKIENSIPIHLCDVVGLIAPIAILTHRRVFRAILYYWGIGLSTQAIFTPELQEGLAGLTFWVFWIPHGMIIVLAIYDLAAFRYRPNWKDYAVAAGTLAVFVAMVFPLNIWLNVNYVYVGQGRPGQPSVVDFLGPWPFRVLKMTLGVLLVFALMTLPFEIARRVQRKRAAPNLVNPAPADAT
jgi:hypothetical integral membrane protein (TIGR02206 family)